MGPSVISTKHLILRIEQPQNADKVLDLYLRNKEVFEEYEPTRPSDFYTLEFHHNILVREQRAYQLNRFIRYYIYKESHPNMIIGSINFNIGHDLYGNYAELGYKVDKLFQGQGIASEACLSAIESVTQFYDLYRIDARIHPTNKPSIALATKLNFRPLRVEKNAANIKGKDVDLIRYSLITSNIQ